MRFYSAQLGPIRYPDEFGSMESPYRFLTVHINRPLADVEYHCAQIEMFNS